LRGSGTFDNGVENSRIKVTLASKIPAEGCARLSLGYADPDKINIAEWQGCENNGVLFVPKAGEMLYRVRKP
jgi:hypothetical protein